jgi:hypothetical protein
MKPRIVVWICLTVFMFLVSLFVSFFGRGAYDAGGAWHNPGEGVRNAAGITVFLVGFLAVATKLRRR